MRHGHGFNDQLQIEIDNMLLNVYLCADTISGIAAFASELQEILPQQEKESIKE